jgi:hypothetical protein
MSLHAASSPERDGLIGRERQRASEREREREGELVLVRGRGGEARQRGKLCSLGGGSSLSGFKRRIIKRPLTQEFKIT